MSAQWWTDEVEYEYEHGATGWHRSRVTGIVWDQYRPHDENEHPRYLAMVRILQHDDQDVPDISLWTHNGQAPPPVLTVDQCRTLGHALLEAAELVDRERDAIIRRFVDGQTPR